MVLTSFHATHTYTHSLQLYTQLNTVRCVLEMQHENSDAPGRTQMEVYYSNQYLIVRWQDYCSFNDSRWLSNWWMGFISSRFILISCNQTVLCLMDCDKAISSVRGMSTASQDVFWPGPSHCCWDIIPIIVYPPERWFAGLLMFTVRLFTYLKKELNHQCFIHHDLWIFEKQRSSSNASQVNSLEAC